MPEAVILPVITSQGFVLYSRYGGVHRLKECASKLAYYCSNVTLDLTCDNISVPYTLRDSSVVVVSTMDGIFSEPGVRL